MEPDMVATMAKRVLSEVKEDRSGRRSGPIQLDRRRSKVILSDSELARLLKSAESAPVYYNTVVDGPDRAMLYRVAAYTGLRASELASLTRESFDLASRPPRVSPAARDQKAKRPDVIPIPAAILGALRKWLAELWGYRCERCGHEWLPRNKTESPRVCPKCKSPYWDRAKVIKDKPNQNDQKRSSTDNAA